MQLNRKQKYLQIALNGNISDSLMIVDQLPSSDRIIIEAGTPLLKLEGVKAIRILKTAWENKLLGILANETSTKITLSDILKAIKNKKDPTTPVSNGKNAYIVADYKAMDRGIAEVSLAAENGASAITVLGQAPVETQDVLIEACRKTGIDSIIDMMNVEKPYKTLRKLKKLPSIVMLHRGVDEEEYGVKPFPIHQINKIKGAFDVTVAIGGGDKIRQVQSAIFNGADIVMVWKDFYKLQDTTSNLAEEFLKIIK